MLGMNMLGGAAAEIQAQPELPTLGWVLGSRCCVHGCLFVQFSTVRVLVQSVRPNSEHQLRCIPGFVLFCNAKDDSCHLSTLGGRGRRIAGSLRPD